MYEHTYDLFKIKEGLVPHCLSLEKAIGTTDPWLNHLRLLGL